MSDRFFEENKLIYETPENNVKMAALKLMRFKAMREMERDNKYSDYALTIDDVNEILTVAGLPVIVPGELEAKELKVIIGNKKEEEE